MDPQYTDTAQTVDRFTHPLYTAAEAAQYLAVPVWTFKGWVHGYTRKSAEGTEIKGDPIVTVIGAPGARRRRYEPILPFIGLAEGLVLAAIRKQGVPLQRIRPALRVLEDQMGIEHALASKALYTDGAEVLYDYSEQEKDTPAAQAARQLIVVRNGQGVFNEAVASFLHRITYGSDGYARVIRLPQYAVADIVADPARSFGQPIFSHGGARVSDVLQLFWAGEDWRVVAQEYGVPEIELQDAIRAASRRAA
jgi:uncharacterized protein (DUF433 family)